MSEGSAFSRNRNRRLSSARANGDLFSFNNLMWDYFRRLSLAKWDVPSASACLDHRFDANNRIWLAFRLPMSVIGARQLNDPRDCLVR
jgi:hypothetical protein